LLGKSGVTFCAAPAVAILLRKGFPKSLDHAPALVPTENTPMRRALESWFRRQRIHPRVVGEFDDAALMKVMACEGAGFIAVPTIMANDASARYGFQVIGATLECQVEFYAITGERRLAHPGVVLIAERAAQRVFATRTSRKAVARGEESAPKQRRAKRSALGELA
jgi:LysR family transcriptional activator of nhaA